MIICFGELLVRLSAPDHQRLLQSPMLDVAIGGAEANVAVGLARFGHSVCVASAVPNNDLGFAAIAELRKHGVNTDRIVTRAGRMGLYFLSTGALNRPSAVLYDRANSVFALEAKSALPPDHVLAGAHALHISGISPAVSPEAAEATLSLVRAAVERGISISFDGNYRAQLWAAWAGDGPAILKEIIACASIAFINEKDLTLILKEGFPTRAAAYERAFSVFPRLQWIAATTRELASVGDQTLGGELVSRSGRWISQSYDLRGVVDRIGAGDAFAAGVLHGLYTNAEPQEVIEFAVASSVIKHSIPGDFNLTSVDEVNASMAQSGLDVRR